MITNQKIVSLTKNRYEWLIVDICWDSHRVALIDLLVVNPRRPFLKSIDEISVLLKSKVAESVEHEFPTFLFRKDNKIPQKHLKKRDEALEALSPILGNDETRNRYLFGDSSGIVSNLVKQTGRSKKFITSNINKYFYHGGFHNALLPGYYNCGRNYQPPKKPEMLEDGSPCLSSKRGRRTKYGEEHRGITQHDIENLKAFSKKIPSGYKVVLEDLYRSYCNQHFMVTMNIISLGETEPTREKILMPAKNRFSKRTFIRHIKKLVSKIEFIRREKGQISYNRDNKGKPGMALQGLRGATSRYEIDATIADVYIRYRFSKKKRLATGRPVIYLVVDTFTGMIVGVYVCFDGPNWHGASQALFNAMVDKVEFCAQYGITISESDWPCHHVCSEVTFDRGGENTDRHLGGIVRAKTGINIVNVTAYHRGEAKGTVEQNFAILQESSIRFEAGQVLKNPSKEDPHASRKAMYTIDDFMKILIKSILLKNKTQIRNTTHNFEMLRDEVTFTPLDIWNWSINNAIISPKVSKGRLRMTFLPEKEATITDKGVLLNGLYYSSNYALQNRWYDIAKNEGRSKISVRYTSTSTNHIWYQDDDTKEIIQFDLTDRCEGYKNSRWEDVLHQLEIRKHQEAVLKETKLSERIKFDRSIDEIEREIRKANRHMITSSSKGIETGMKERQATESALERQRDYQDIIEDLNELNRDSLLNHGLAQKASCAHQNLNDPNEIPWEDYE